LYDQAPSPWRFGFPIESGESSRLVEAGANVDGDCVVHWPGDTLRRFMLEYVLPHELGHHLLQHERRLKGRAAARTSEHEGRAEAIAAQLRTVFR
jgi:hypothetical protein